MKPEPNGKKLRVTLDTNTLDSPKMERVRRVVEGLPVEFVLTTVTERELKGTDLMPDMDLIAETGVWGESAWGSSEWGGVSKEVLVLNESPLGIAQLGAESDSDSLEEILKVISNGSFPKRGSRDDLSEAQRRQLRDAMILTAHVRERRDVFVSDDHRGFIGKENRVRNRLEPLCKTKIMTTEEFCDFCRESRDELKT